MEKYKDASVPVEERVEDLLSRMTLEEKAAQLCGNLPTSFIEDGDLSMDKLREVFPNGHGRFTQYSMLGLVSPEKIAEISNKLQDYFVNETRLGIPVALQSENLCGYPAAQGTMFPSQINLGCTWEPELAGKMSHVIGQESRAVGITSAMSPVIDVSRDPRWGRTYETYGEDPYLISQFGIGYVRGMQEEGVSCIAKHFLGYACTQGGMNTTAANINDRELYEIFATPFEAAMREASLGGVMGNYGEIDGLPVISNRRIAHDFLRDTLKFDGMLISDGAAIFKQFTSYKLARTYEECGLIAKKAGCDSEIPVGGSFMHIPEWVRDGKLDEAVVDESVRRILKIKFDMGLFENPYCDVEKLKDAFTTPEKSALSLEIAKKSLVLLKNEDHVLPLKKGTKVAVIGPHGGSLRYPVSGYTYPAYIEMLSAGANGGETTFNGIADEAKKNEAEKKKEKSPFANMFAVFTPEEQAHLTDMNSVLREMGAKTLTEALSGSYEVSYAEGCTITGSDTSGFAEAVKTAEEADVVVMTLGGNCGWVNVTGGEGKDRQSLDLPGVQQQLLETVAAVGKPVVLILYGPGVFAVNWAEEHVSSILQAFMPGQFAAEAVAAVLCGAYNPGGRLTMSVPRSTGQIPLFYNHKNGSGYHSGGDTSVASVFSGGYVDGSDRPLYSFGYGLSYTTFTMHDLQCASEVPTDGTVEVSCQVTNTGDMAGTETVQLYTSFYGAHVTRPAIQLCGFHKVALEPGETKTVHFHLKTSQLAYFNEEMKYVVEPGELTVMIGANCDAITERAAVELTGAPVEMMGKRSYTCASEAE